MTQAVFCCFPARAARKSAFRKRSLAWLAVTLTLSPVASILLPAVRAGLVPVGTETFFVTPGQSSTLRWKIDERGISATGAFTLTNYHGEPTGISGLPETLLVQNDQAELTLTLPQGYFEIHVPLASTPDAPRQTFGVLSLPAFDRAQLDPYFCVDSALSWLERSGDQRRSLIRMMRRSGIALSRERFSWQRLSPAHGTWHWGGNPNLQYDRLRSIYAEENMPILECFHDSPKWMNTNGSYPADLLTATGDLIAIHNRWGRAWGALELWNETDAAPFSKNRAMEQYAAFVHATAAAFGGAGIRTPIVGAAYSGYKDAVINNALRNDLLSSIDALSYHTYARPDAFESHARKYRDALKRSSRPAIPLWITESGSPWTTGTDRPSVAEDLVSALNITGKVSEGRAVGIARMFPFVTAYYPERNKNFGMVGKEGTPLRSFAAYAVAISLLANHDYVGDLRFPKNAGVQLARVFRSPATPGQALAVILADEPRPGATVPFDLPAADIRGIDGRRLARPAPDTLPLDDGLAYIRLDQTALERSGRIDIGTTAMALYREARQPDTGRDPSSPVILQFVPEARHVLFGAEINTINHGNLQDFPLRIRAVNLDPRQARTLTLNATVAPLRHNGTDPAAATPLAPPQTLAISPRTGKTITIPADLRSAFRDTETITIRVTARTTGQIAGQPAPARIRDLSIDFMAERSLDELLAACGKKLPLDITDAGKWNTAHINKRAGGRITVTAQKRDHVTLDIAFDKDGGEDSYWAYPRFPVPRDADLRGAVGMIVRARASHPGSARAFVWKRGGTGYFTSSPWMPTDGEWHAVLIPFAKLRHEWSTPPDTDPNLIDHLDRVGEISIGVNTFQRVNRIDVSDVIIVWPMKQESIVPLHQNFTRKSHENTLLSPS
ncbi:MAG: hypothetical protein LBK99_14505 [Opitutaceae bacterium]|nr:hypothetical protein [Opitutaceae bacterium]